MVVMLRRLLLLIPFLIAAGSLPAAVQPTAGPRMVAEWEPALGTLIRWPLGIPVELVRELGRDDVVYTLVETSGAEQQARSTFAAAGVDLDHVEFIRGELWSMWTRDWGPQAVFTAEGTLAYADPWFAGYPWVPGCDGSPAPEPPLSSRRGRGYEEDDVLPAVVAEYLGQPLSPLNAYLTGGNVMTDGLGIGWSTAQMLDENAPFMDQATFIARVEAVMGLDDYRFVIEPEVYGIQHIDCYAKLLDEETVLVKEVPTWHPEAGCCDQVAAAFAEALTCYGRPYRVLRIFCDVYSGQAAAAYTNSLILNRKVLVPMFGIDADHDALATYQDALPGYEVIGFAHDGWYDYDALHCRTMGIFDPGMLRLLHAPVNELQPAGAGVAIAAWIDDRSGAGLPSTQSLLWRLAGETSWQEVPMVATGGDSLRGIIPAPPAAAEVQYRIEASDLSGRQASSPRGTRPAHHAFVVDQSVAVPAARAGLALEVWPNPFNPRTELIVSGGAATAVDLRLYDLRGRLVATLLEREVGVTRAIWDGTDDRGRTSPSGVYLAVVQSSTSRAIARLVLQR
jgi:agmatine/peptidylarginine deiminase